MAPSNNGVILERLSGKKLLILVSIIFTFQILFLLIGCLKFPNATHTETIEGIMCKEKFETKNSKFLQSPKNKNNHAENKTIYYLRDYLGRAYSNCDRIEVDEHNNLIFDIEQKDIIYAFQIPLPRDNKVLKLHRWFQTMTSIMQLQVLLPPTLREVTNENEAFLEHVIPLDVNLAYKSSKDLDDQWSLMASKSIINKKFTCQKNIYSLDCNVVQLFELGSVHHEFYVVNVKLGESKILNELKYDHSTKKKEKLYKKIELPEVRLVLTFIYQTGGFTQIWLIMKTCVLPFVFVIMIWYWNRVNQLDRKSNHLERMLLALGISATLLNLPVEWLTLYYDLKWMLLWADLRQGIFYSTLFTFWIIFCGEHYIDENQNDTKHLKSYWRYVIACWFGCICLLVFEMCERGMQLSDPFFSIWDSKLGSNLAMTMIILASCSGLLYFCLLIYLVIKVFLNIRYKQTQLPAMSRMRRIFYEGIIYRFNFLLASTVFCAAMTIACFIVNNINESKWNFSEEESIINYTGGFFTFVYGMWNLYTISVMIFYAPSHKTKLNSQYHDNQETDESIEFVNLQAKFNAENSTIASVTNSTTESVLTAFANKISAS